MGESLVESAGAELSSRLELMVLSVVFADGLSGVSRPATRSPAALGPSSPSFLTLAIAFVDAWRSVGSSLSASTMVFLIPEAVMTVLI